MDKDKTKVGATKLKELFIIHGWSYNLDKWQAILPELEAKGFKPIMLNVPGLTETSDKVWTIDDYIDWLDTKLKGYENPAVIGHSNGGRIALSYLQKYPNRFKRLILIDSAGLKTASLMRSTKLKFLYVLSKIGHPLSKITWLRKAFYKVIGAQDYYEARGNMRETMQNMLAADKTIDLSKIKTPVTIIWGREDTITPLKDGERMHKLLPGSDLHVIDGAKHAPQDTHPKEVAELIAEAVI